MSKLCFVTLMSAYDYSACFMIVIYSGDKASVQCSTHNRHLQQTGCCFQGLHIALPYLCIAVTQTIRIILSQALNIIYSSQSVNIVQLYKTPGAFFIQTCFAYICASVSQNKKHKLSCRLITHCKSPADTWCGVFLEHA